MLFECAIYVLDMFEKKAKRGIATPKSDLNLIRHRLKLAEKAIKEAESCVPYNGSSLPLW